MTKNIKGITIEFEGDTTGLTQALKKVDGETKKVQTELKQVENLLKFDPSNVELLAQKQKLLGDAVDSTSKRLDALKQAQSEVERQFKNGEIGEEAFRKFQREIIATENKLDAFKKQVKAVDAKIDMQADTSKLDKAKSALKGLGSTAESVGKEIGNGLKKGFEVGAKAAAGVGVAMAGAAVGAGAFVESQKEMNMDLARLRTNAEQSGRSLSAMEEGCKKVAVVSGEADSAIEAVSNLMATGFDDNQLAEALDYVNGAAIKFSDTLKTEGIADGIQETFATGAAIGPFAELLERSGVNIDTFNEGLATATKNGTQADYILQQLSQLGLKETYDAYTENNAALNEYNQAQLDSQVKMAALAEQMQPFVTMLMNLGNIVLDVVLGNKSFADGLNELIKIVKGLAEQLFNAAKEAMPKFLRGITDALPRVLEMGSKILNNIVDGIIKNYPIWLETAVSLATNLISKLTEMLPQIQKMGLDLLLKLVQGIISNLPQIISAAFRIITSLISGLGQALPQMITYLLTDLIPSIIRTIVDADWIGIGKSIIQGLIDGVKAMAKALIGSVGSVIGGAIEGAKNLLKINSPSKVFFEMGEFTNEGFIQGIERSSKSLYNAMDSVYGSLVSSTQMSLGNTAANYSTNTTTTNAPISNVFQVTIDAKNVREFNDVVEFMQVIGQTARAR